MAPGNDGASLNVGQNVVRDSSMAASGSAERSRYVVGMDLGTTNSAVCYVDTMQRPTKVRTFVVPQAVAAGQIEGRETLPSFHYQPAVGELAPGAVRQSWQANDPPAVVGVFAREQGAVVPGRMINSAKSWLCHSGVDRTAELLPWHGADDVDRLSPVEVSARYIRHVREAWDAKFPDHPLAQQDFVLTLPASFDEVARELTVKAAAAAGLPRVVLIEEPQAVFYAWIDAHADRWESVVAPGQKILICDVGGGTSDFTLIRVRRGEGGKVQFHRVAVGDHLILGGDNLDLALAHFLERKLLKIADDDPQPRRLEPRQWGLLVRIAQRAKELLLGPNPPERYTVTLPGSGSKLIGGALQAEVSRAEVESLLVDGFLPRCELDSKPTSRRSGFQEFGLPFAADPAVTKYLAQFLTAHRHVGLGESAATDADSAVADSQPHDPARPDIVLFNGGFFESPVLRARLLDVLCSWFRQDAEAAAWSPIVLENERLDLAVARGAAYYGMVLRGEGVRIAAGLPRTYYVGVEANETTDAATALCLLPAGLEPGQSVDLTSRTFELALATPVEFPLFVSSTRLIDQPGELVTVDREQLTSLPPIRTVLRAGKKNETGSVSVQLHARLTEIGTLEMWCSELSGPRSWKLQFDVRSTTQTDVAAHAGTAEQLGFVDSETEARCRQLIADAFGPDATLPPASLMKQLGTVLDGSRQDWPPSLLRSLWAALLENAEGRKRSVEHETRWLNLMGFSLRPGYGLAMDDWRTNETWKQLQGKPCFNEVASRQEWWIMWRRIVGGLSAGQQLQLASPLIGQLRQRHKQLTTGKGAGGDLPVQAAELNEIFRLFGSLELLSLATKDELGELLLDVFPKSAMTAVRPTIAWAIGRIASRVPMYGPLNRVVSVERVEGWLSQLLAFDLSDSLGQLAVLQLSRKTGDRYRDVSDNSRRRAADWLRAKNAPEHYVELVLNGGELSAEEQGLIFGESLPKGLKIG